MPRPPGEESPPRDPARRPELLTYCADYPASNPSLQEDSPVGRARSWLPLLIVCRVWRSSGVGGLRHLRVVRLEREARNAGGRVSARGLVVAEFAGTVLICGVLGHERSLTC